MNEFDLIERIRRRAGKPSRGVALGIGDDAAVLQVPPGQELLATTDTLNGQAQFFPEVPPRCLGHKSLAVNLSDLAAMGAQPAWALLSLSLPGGDAAWLDEFIEGFLSLAQAHRVQLVGGDTCAGPISVTVTALGLADAGRALRRSGASPGELVVVSGTLGSAGLALAQLKSSQQPVPELLAALLRPEPRVALGRALAGIAGACIDVSDGLLADLGHITRASACGATLELAKLPAGAALAACPDRVRWDLQLTAGDDYELCFTVSEANSAELQAVARVARVPLSVVGRIDPEPGIRCVAPGGQAYEPGAGAYEHFR
jgi:thiamine-monophosphate kinase